MKHRHRVREDRNFARTGEGHRNVRPSVARVLLAVDFDGDIPPAPPTDGELWEAMRAEEEAAELYCAAIDPVADACCGECAEHSVPLDVLRDVDRLRTEAWAVEAAYWG